MRQRSLSDGVLGVLAMAAAFLPARLLAANPQRESPGVGQLPVIRELPDPFLNADKSRVKTKEDWAKRRAEILELILTFEYGHAPTQPTEVKATEGGTTEASSFKGSIREFTLTMGPGGKVSVPLVMTIPPGKGPFPIVIKGDLCWGRVSAEIARTVVERGYILAEFDRTAVAPDKDDRSTGVFPLYPDSDWGDLAAWAWGFSRVIDYVSTRADVDPKQIIITGHSRGGKATLLAGAVDERVALTVPNGSGAGGAGCFRIGWPMCETLQVVDANFPFWFCPQFKQFIGHVEQLPFDQHELKALIAPRALFTTDSLDDLWANPLGTQMSFLASRDVFEFLGARDKTGLHYRHGKHDQNEEDWAALLDFADWQVLGKKPSQTFDALPFPQTPPTHTWVAPHGNDR